MVPIVFGKAARFCIALARRRGKERKGKLSDLHARAQYYWDVVLVGYFERNVKEVARINKPCRIVDHEPHARQARLTAELDQKVVGAKKIFRGA